MASVPTENDILFHLMKTCYIVMDSFLSAIANDHYINVHLALKQTKAPGYDKNKCQQDEKEYIDRFLEMEKSMHLLYTVLMASLKTLGRQFRIDFVQHLEIIRGVRNTIYFLVKNDTKIENGEAKKMKKKLNAFERDVLQYLNNQTLNEKVSECNPASDVDRSQLFDTLTEWIKSDHSFGQDYLLHIKRGKFRKREYRNWIKLTIALAEGRKCLSGFVFGMFDEFTKGNLKVCNGTTLSEESRNHMKVHTHFEPSCPKCEEIKKITLKLKVKKTSREKGSSLKNKRIPRELYLLSLFGAGMKLDSVRDPESYEVQDLCRVMQDCRLFHLCDANLLRMVASVRNKVFHSPDNTMEGNETDDCFNIIIQLLNILSNHQDVPEKLKRKLRKGERIVEEIKVCEINISIFKDSSRALVEKKRALIADLAEAEQVDVERIAGLLEDIGKEKVFWEDELERAKLKMLSEDDLSNGERECVGNVPCLTYKDNCPDKVLFQSSFENLLEIVFTFVYCVVLWEFFKLAYPFLF
ncbi:uncharacterized protein CXorf38-like [Mya arenaria]|uniref:uncharacterized protein CXorf38-like n=1 Tax=Mya arenaria TaxID=6604 RepID=UPI0022E56DC4|nr:uncharacterized protein CXorf38-like [Mya arenaria]